MMKTLEQKQQRHQQGQSLMEFALILPILLLVVFGIIDFGRILFVYSNVSGALRDAARYAAVLGFNSAAPEYAKCDEIEAQALSAMFVSDEVVDIYYWDTTNPQSPLTAFTPDAYIVNGRLNQHQVLASAHYACNGGSTLAIVGINDPTLPGGVQANGSQFDNGDLMRVHYTGRIGFMTPFLSAVWSGIDLDFFAQRTIITKITLGSSDGIDYDYDGLDDRWEFMWWGCMDDDDNIWLVTDGYRFDDIENWRDWTVTRGGTTIKWYQPGVDDDDQICDIRWVEDPNDPSAEVPMPQTVVLSIDDGGTNAIRDHDADGCNAGCEELRNSQPITYFGHDGSDTDRDGLSDGNEANIYFTDPTGGDFHHCDNNVLVQNVPDGIPDGYDSDCDGVPDGVEVGSDAASPDVIIQPNDPVEYPGYEGTGTLGYPYRPSNPFSPDSNPVDGMFDSVDSDGDTLYDYQEYYDDTPCDEANRNIPTIPGRNYTIAPGTPYDCLYIATVSPTNALGINFPTHDATLLTSAYMTSSSIHDDDNDGAMDGRDSDEDGLDDNVELAGFGPFTFTRNRETVTVTYYTHPNYPDGDGDGLLDGEELGTPIGTLPIGPGYTNPDNPDSDGDGLTDAEEADYGTNPLDNDGDRDNLPDNLEVALLTTAPYAARGYAANPDPANPNSDGNAGSGTDSDGNGVVDTTNPATGELLSGETLIIGNENACDQMNDGFEVNTLRTDPTELDTDSDGISDCKEEMDIFLDALNPDFDGDGALDGADCDPRDDTVSTGCDADDSDGDNLPDSWEITWFDNIGGSDTDTLDPDNDGCNNLCEYQRGTNPSNEDNNTCIFNAATNSRTYIVGTPDGNPDGVDTDCDGLNDMQDPVYNGYPADPDSDDDGLWDGTEAFYTYGGVTQPLQLRNPHSDTDLLTDYEEFYNGSVCGGLGTNAADADTDDDGLADHLEVAPMSYLSSFPTAYADLLASGTFTGTDPCNDDGDGDNLLDGQEIYLYTGANPNDNDTDGDGIRDDLEVSTTLYAIYDVRTCEVVNGIYTGNYSGNLTSPQPDGVIDGLDTDCDGLADGDEYYNLAATDLRDNTPFNGLPMTIVLCEGTAEQTSFNINITTLSPVTYDSDVDDVGDGAEFYEYETNPQSGDTDGDTRADGVEIADGTDPLCGGTVTNTDDNDGDGLTNIEEQGGFDLSAVNSGVGSSWTSSSHPNGWIVTNPDNVDSDGDGIHDPDELDGRIMSYTYYNGSNTAVPRTNILIVTNPTHLNEDGDSLPDGRDSDDDGINDGVEFGITGIGSTVMNIDCNGDGDFSDTNEGTNQTRITNPAMYDTDGDGMPDGAEVANRTDPLRATCGPSIIFAKMGDELDTGLEMYWHFTGSGTESMTNLEAEQAAMLYIDTYYETNLSGGVFTTMTVGFVGSQNCNSGYATLKSVIESNGGTNVPASGSNVNGKCMLTANVTFAQLIAIGFNSYITKITDTFGDQQ